MDRRSRFHVLLAALAVGAACGGSREPLKPIALAATSSSTVGVCALFPDGSVTCWGSVVGTRTPTPLSGITDAIAISLGCFVRRDGRVSCFDHLLSVADAGSDDAASSGLSPGQSLSLVDVAGIADARSISVGNEVACVVRATGAVSCWGTSGAGELGASVAIGAPSGAVDIVGLSDATQVTLGGAGNACALTSQGKVLCWGSVFADNGTATAPYVSSTPVVVPLPTAAAALTTGTFPTCAALVTGAVWCWDETSVPNAPVTPAAVAGVTDVVALSTGSCRVVSGNSSSCTTCAVRRDGSTICWGYAGLGLVRGSTATDIATPTVAPGLPLAKQIVVGEAAACILGQDASVWCWGDGSFGEIGPGGASAATPVRIAL